MYKNTTARHTLSLQQALGYSDLFWSVWIPSVRNTLFKVISLQRTCGDRCQLNMATQLEQWSKHAVQIVKRFFN